MNGIDNQFLIFFVKNSYWSVFVEIIIFWSRILLDVSCNIVALFLREHWKYALLLLLSILSQASMQHSFTSSCEYSCLLYVYSLFHGHFFAIMHWLFASYWQFRFYDKKKHRYPKAVSFSVIKSTNNSIFDIFNYITCKQAHALNSELYRCRKNCLVWWRNTRQTLAILIWSKNNKLILQRWVLWSYKQYIYWWCASRI